jgi:hypothetical protein
MCRRLDGIVTTTGFLSNPIILTARGGSQQLMAESVRELTASRT